VTRDEWIASFAREAGVAPASVQEIRQLLELAAVAAHASERTAAPLACWIAGASDLSVPQLLALAERVSEAARGPDGPGSGDSPKAGGGD